MELTFTRTMFLPVKSLFDAKEQQQGSKRGQKELAPIVSLESLVPRSGCLLCDAHTEDTGSEVLVSGDRSELSLSVFFFFFFLDRAS